MNPNDPNVILLELVARRLGDALRQDLVFVGGAVAGRLITDPAMPAIRPTEDVDLIEECRASTPELKAYLRNWIARLLAAPAFLEALPGHLPGDAASQARAFDLEEKLRQLAKLD